MRTLLSLSLCGLCAAVGFVTIGWQAKNKQRGEDLDRRHREVMELTEMNNRQSMAVAGGWHDRGGER